jgi:hypothetical protein
MSILCLVEHMHIASHDLPPAVSIDLLRKAGDLQQSAVTTLLAIAKRIVDVSTCGEFKIIHSVQAKLQFISHHANTSLVVMALTKAIEHTIDLNLTPAVEVPGGSLLPGNTDWIPSIKILLTCLLTLGSTVSGTITARPALQKLMHQYSDILMDSWSYEDRDCQGHAIRGRCSG